MYLFIGLMLIMILGIILFAIILDKLTYDPKKAPSCWQPNLFLKERN